jgi:hypothetical protein
MSKHTKHINRQQQIKHIYMFTYIDRVADVSIRSSMSSSGTTYFHFDGVTSMRPEDVLATPCPCGAGYCCRIYVTSPIAISRVQEK